MRKLATITTMLFASISLGGQVTTVFAPPLHSFKGSGISKTDAQNMLDLDAGTVLGRDAARRLLEKTLKQDNPSVNLDDKSFYCIINVVRWNKTSAGKPRWYIYHSGDWTDDDFSVNNRIFGVQHPWMLVVHLNSPGTYKLSYQVTVKHRLPLNVQHLVNLATLGGAVGAAPADECQGCIWAAQSLDGNPPADISIIPQISPLDGSKAQNLDDTSAAFNNEGLYRWDISIGVPIKSYKQLQIDNSAGTVTTQNIDKHNLLALADFYPKPVDLNGSNFAHSPYFVGGVALASKPLHSVLVGVGWGPMFANFYAGCMIVTDKNPATNKNQQHYQFAFGLNLPVRAVSQKLGLKQ